MYGLAFPGTGGPTRSEHRQVISAKDRQPHITVWREKGINPGVVIKSECAGARLSSGSPPGCSVSPYPGKILPPSPSLSLLCETEKFLLPGLASDSWRSARCPPAQWPSLCSVHQHPDVLYGLPYKMNTRHISELLPSFPQCRQWDEVTSGCDSL